MFYQSYYLSTDASKTWTLWSVSTIIATLTGGTGGLAAFGDLASGTSYGSVSVTASDVGSYVEASLNASALASLSAATGLWAIGGSITTLGTGDDAVFWFSHEDARVELVVNEISPEPDPTPEPTSLILFGLGVLGMAYSRKKSLQA
ncbi:PEP-CTERM sorting domain-containing protein [Zooshikella harenae]|uniref:PEP-CTERM sorting domain-containing protein n=1 Tax=Zooshikella harenae TaxID=2827238 RepID=A0ABS5ZC05_9GAMM|nr:PEP-CTERM sorting domain-containing protein [Zooshikella harenae]MBU2711587.1 PEP-CTERM sorting domain-containing protein [Zooshikella harenae]